MFMRAPASATERLLEGLDTSPASCGCLETEARTAARLDESSIVSAAREAFVRVERPARGEIAGKAGPEDRSVAERGSRTVEVNCGVPGIGRNQWVSYPTGIPAELSRFKTFADFGNILSGSDGFRTVRSRHHQVLSRVRTAVTN